MSKMFVLREWFYLDDACKHMSARFGEEVSSKDIFALALDGTITLSVRFENSVPIRYAEHIDTRPKGDWGDSFVGMQDFYSIDKTVNYVDGIFDLPLKLGNVEHLRSAEWNGGVSDCIPLDEILLSDSAGRLLVLVESKAQAPGSDAALPFDHYSRYRFTYSLPDGCRYVIRRSEINRLESSLGGEPAQELTARERGSLLNIIGALLALHGGKEAALIAELLDKYPNKSGIKQRTLEEKFSQAKKNLRGD